MAIVYQDGFDHYGDVFTDASATGARFLQSRWAGVLGGANTGPAYPPSIARTGAGALAVVGSSGTTFTSSGGEKGARLVLPSTYSEILIHFAIYLLGGLPVDNGGDGIALHDAGNNFLCGLKVLANGSLSFINAAGAELGNTGALSVNANNWRHIQLRVKVSATVGVVEVWVDNVQEMNLTAQNTGTTNIGQLQFICRRTGFFNYFDDLVVADASGARNNTLMGDLRVATTYPIADTVQAGWTPQPRFKFGAGIGLQPTAIATSTDGITCSDSADFEMGSGDYTLEGWFRFFSSPASNYVTLFSKWREPTNERSFEMIYGSAAFNGGKLAIRTSTDGLAGTVATPLSTAFTPIFGHWHHIAFQRASGVDSIWIDGVFAGSAADAANYFNGGALFAVGGEQSGAASMVAGLSLFGGYEEIRVTKGVARYTAPVGFTPTGPYGRTVGADPSYASVSLLVGFDSAITDESSFARAVTARGAAARFAVTDTLPGSFQTVNNQVPIDDTLMEAPFTAATGILSFTGQPANNETVTFDGVTYTFKTVFVNTAGFVLIGASVDASINNLVAAINAGAGSGTVYGAGTTASVNASVANAGNQQMTAAANAQGTSGNAIATTETIANAVWTAATLTGGLGIPTSSRFALGKLPAQTTGVKALSIITRSRKSDAGAGNLTASFVTADLSTANGANRALTTTFAYNDDVIEVDPSTGSSLSPASFVGSSVRIDRTA